jgi:hypothetical protein
MSDCYGPDGQPMTMTEWSAARSRDDDSLWQKYRQVTDTDSAQVSTVWLGLDHQFGDGPPLIFESIVFGGALDQEMDRYSTWREAQNGHAAMVDRVLRSERLTARVARRFRAAWRAIRGIEDWS